MDEIYKDIKEQRENAFPSENKEGVIKEDADIYFTLQEAELCSIGNELCRITVNKEKKEGYFIATPINKDAFLFNTSEEGLSFSKKQVYNGSLSNGVLKLNSSYEGIRYIVFYNLQRFVR